MPELPEVETTRLGLERFLKGAVIEDVEVRRSGLRFPFPRGFGARLTGSRVERVDRRAKYLLIRLDGGRTWMVHLGMSGHFTFLERGETRRQKRAYSRGVPLGDGEHDHVVVHLENGLSAVYTDPRRFGVMDLLKTSREADHKLLAHLGPEPLDPAWDAAALCESLRGRKTSIKAALLDQKIVVGVGNIYACESLFRSGISPRRLASSIAGKRGVTARAQRLVPTIKAVLQEAIAAGGSSLRDFQAVDGELGYFSHSFEVYDREDEPCLRKSCDGTVRRITQTGRSTFFCSSCQR